ncbi:hypothetical protein MSG28_011894 [Choristoneura fumiferana]|uniref:Uncharacterized protein n=1 Tax=Choristoneura fumiferana TaxID=7141 RepID=A0ACC0KM92_CHOFU|nr:hypothetical protein MSG28_011894 [Choristoneura fumiferana]
MVSTRGVRYKFSEGERVLCYEPDPTKAKVLYDSKTIYVPLLGRGLLSEQEGLGHSSHAGPVRVGNFTHTIEFASQVLEVIESKDKRGRRSVEYLIHFQGWNSSWDRCVSEDFVLKDTEENRQLQRDLAEKSQLQLGAYLYRRERKKCSSASGGGPAKRTRHGFSDDGSSSSTPPDEGETGDTDSSSISGSSSARSPPPLALLGRANITLPSALRDRLTFDYHLVVKRGRLSRLPAAPSAAQVLESFVKWFARAGAWHPARPRHDPPVRPDLLDVSCSGSRAPAPGTPARPRHDPPVRPTCWTCHAGTLTELSEVVRARRRLAPRAPAHDPPVRPDLLDVSCRYKIPLNNAYFIFSFKVHLSQPIYVPLLGTGLLLEQEGLSHSSHAGPVRIENFTRTIELLRRLNLVREVADGLRVYFDFVLRAQLLYKQERAQYHDLCGQFLHEEETEEEDIKSEMEEDESAPPEVAQSTAAEAAESAERDIKSPKIPEYSHLPPDPVPLEKTEEDTANTSNTVPTEEQPNNHSPATAATTDEAGGGGSGGGSVSGGGGREPEDAAVDRARDARPATRSGHLARRLRSHKSAVSQSENEEPAPCTSTGEQRTFETLSSSVGSSGSSLSECWARPAQAAAPAAAPTRTPLSQLLDKVAKWQIVPREGTEHLPCRVYGAIHLARLFVKLPDFLNATQMPDFKLKLILKHVDMFIQYLDEHSEWFGEMYYIADNVSRSH